MTTPVRVRFAPSPTGPLHIGSVRSALFNWLFARRHGGQFILRIEDTDQKRYEDDALSLITNGLRWVGIDWDEGPEVGGDYGPYFQSERLDIYQKWSEELIAQAKAYRCYCSEERLARVREIAEKSGKRLKGYDRHCRNLSAEEQQKLHEENGGNFVVRFAMPLEGQTAFNDMARGEIVFDNKELNDLVLMKSDGYPTYHLANVLDDHLMEITHIMRGDEWISTAPVHKQLYTAFGWDMPEIIHLPLILNPDGKGKLSKRTAAKLKEQGIEMPTLLTECQEMGYIPSAIVNFLTNTGWHMRDDREVFTVEEAIAEFDPAHVSASPTAFDIDKLVWLNGVHIREMDPTELTQLIKPYIEEAGYEVNVEALLAITPHIQERLKTLAEVVEWTAFLWKEDFEPVEAEVLLAKKMDAAQTQAMLRAAYDTLANLDNFSYERQETALRALVGELEIKAGQLFNSLRWAIIAQKVSPPLFQSMAVLGRDKVLERIEVAIQSLDALIPATE